MTLRRFLFRVAVGAAACGSVLTGGAAEEVETGVEIIPFQSPWEVLMLMDGSGGQMNPQDVDSDFLDTWTTAAYDGPPFTPATAPVSYGIIDYFITQMPGAGSQLPFPTVGSRGTVYLRRTIDLPEDLDNIQMEYLADDGFILYVDGVRWTSENMPAGSTSGFSSFTSLAGSESMVTFLPRSGSSFPRLAMGKHTIHVSVHNLNTGSSDLGFMLKLTGDLIRQVPALVAEVSAPSTDGSPRVLLRATGLNPATAYLVQLSNDLEHWITVDTVPAGEDRTGFTLDVPAISGRRFYRLAQ